MFIFTVTLISTASLKKTIGIRVTIDYIRPMDAKLRRAPVDL